MALLRSDGKAATSRGHAEQLKVSQGLNEHWVDDINLIYPQIFVKVLSRKACRRVQAQEALALMLQQAG